MTTSISTQGQADSRLCLSCQAGVDTENLYSFIHPASVDTTIPPIYDSANSHPASLSITHDSELLPTTVKCSNCSLALLRESETSTTTEESEHAPEIEFDEEGNTPLIKAVRSGHLDAVKQVLSSENPHIEEASQLSSKTPLIYAIEGGNISIVQALVEAGADLNHHDIWGNTPLMEAASKGQIESINLLISRGCDVNLSDDFGYTALMTAARKGCILGTTALIRAGADINHRQGDGGNTALMEAVEGGSATVVQLLLAAGASPSIGDDYGNTPISKSTGAIRDILTKALIKERIEKESDLGSDNAGIPPILQMIGDYIDTDVDLLSKPLPEKQG